MEILFASSYDDKYGPENILNSSKGLWTSTGLFPQEVVIQLESPKIIKSINLSTYAVKKISIETCENDSAVNFIKQAEMQEVPFTEGKTQDFFLNFNQNSKAKLVKLKIDEGYDDFISIKSVNFT